MTGTCAILPRDFIPGQTRWTAGTMRHVIHALDGHQVLLTTSSSSGFTIVARLLQLRRNPGYGDYQVLAETELDDGQIQQTWYALFALGATVIPLPDQDSTAGRLKWAALESYHDEVSRAVGRIRAQCSPDELHNGFLLDERGLCGNWKATPMADVVYVQAVAKVRDGQHSYEKNIRTWNLPLEALDTGPDADSAPVTTNTEENNHDK